jgi:hypothetical protein
MEFRVVGSFRDAARAQECMAALRGGGIDPTRISVAGESGYPAPRPPRDAEAPFLGRLVVIVVLWSMADGSAAMGLAQRAASARRAAGIGIQIASWAIFAHLIAGMWAGYALLTRGESREPVRRTADGRVLVSVRCDGEAASRAASEILRRGAAAVGVYDASGRPVSDGG